MENILRLSSDGKAGRRASRMRTPLYIALVSLSLLSLNSKADATQSTFDTNSEGWSVADWNNPDLSTIVQTFSVGWISSGGNPGGYINASDLSDNWFWFSAPAKFLGNKSAAFGTSLQFDLSVSIYASEAPVVILTGAGQRLYFLGNSPPTTFASYNIPLTPTGWRLNDYKNGIEPTPAIMQSVLGNLDGLYIDGDWHNGIETAGLDNVRLVPEPTSLALLILVALFSLQFLLCRGRDEIGRPSPLDSAAPRCCLTTYRL